MFIIHISQKLYVISFDFHGLAVKAGGKKWQTTSLCALPGKRQWFIVVTKGRFPPDGTFHKKINIYRTNLH